MAKCKRCDRCGRRIIFRFVGGSRVALDSGTGKKHVCGSDVYDLPANKIFSLFSPKGSKYKK